MADQMPVVVFAATVVRLVAVSTLSTGATGFATKVVSDRTHILLPVSDRRER